MDRSGEETDTTTYQFEVDRDTWQQWKNTVPRDQSLYERIVDLLEADAEHRLEDVATGSDTGWVCSGCGKYVSGSMPVDQCSDCGEGWLEATPDRLACDRCGDGDAVSASHSDYNRLCGDCISEENISMYGDRLADAAKIMRGEADELAARDDVDDHLNDVIEGLRHHAEEVEEFLQEEYDKDDE